MKRSIRESLCLAFLLVCGGGCGETEIIRPAVGDASPMPSADSAVADAGPGLSRDAQSVVPPAACTLGAWGCNSMCSSPTGSLCIMDQATRQPVCATFADCRIAPDGCEPGTLVAFGCDRAQCVEETATVQYCGRDRRPLPCVRVGGVACTPLSQDAGVSRDVATPGTDSSAPDVGVESRDVGTVLPDRNIPDAGVRDAGSVPTDAVVVLPPCHGSTDFFLIGRLCGSGACLGRYECQVRSGRTMVVCASPVAPGIEACDGIDNDCDGVTDESFGTETCGIGVCRRTMDRCIAGRWQMCTPSAPDPFETCGNGLDDNCNGLVDEDCPTDCGRACVRGTGACLTNGVIVCSGSVATCNAPFPPAPSSVEICADGIDNDCDSVTDEASCDPPSCGMHRDGDYCVVGLGACRVSGAWRCSPGVCNVTPGLPRSEVCDNSIDDDCDGWVDEDCPICSVIPGSSCSVGIGACRRDGVYSCSGSSSVCSVAPGLPVVESATAGNCADGVDNDCDGVTDAADATCAAPTVAMYEYYVRVTDATLDAAAPYRLRNQWWAMQTCANTGTSEAALTSDGWYRCDVRGSLSPFVWTFVSRAHPTWGDRGQISTVDTMLNAPLACPPSVAPTCVPRAGTEQRIRRQDTGAWLYIGTSAGLATTVDEPCRQNCRHRLP